MSMLTAIIVAAGSSRRMGFDKLFETIAGKPVLAHTIAAFENAKSVSQILVVARKNRRGEIENIARDQNWKKVGSVVTGGEHRQDSVRAGLSHLDESAQYVAVHDAARPLITPEQIERVFRQCRAHGAAVLAASITDTVKRSDKNLYVTDSVDRHQLYAMQTPQIFERKLLEQGYRSVAEKNLAVTDEVSAVELIGAKVALVVNEEFDFKITYPRDLAVAEFVLEQRARRS
jgi:2-C-methyl-D-erythritol 4-phosphate cytidylyltransferase